MIFDDQTEIRHRKETKTLWRAAAAKDGKKLSVWIRDTLIDKALEILTPGR